MIVSFLKKIIIPNVYLGLFVYLFRFLDYSPLHGWVWVVRRKYRGNLFLGGSWWLLAALSKADTSESV